MELPSVYMDRASCLYILVEDISKELEDFILTGKTETRELHVFPYRQEQTMIIDWAQLGYTAAYRRQQIEYMGIEVTINYLTVRNAETGVRVSLIPWFMLPGRGYLVFIYAYAIWHYHITGKKSLKETALATGKLFKIESLNKSTVSRSIKAMEGFIDVSRIGVDAAEGAQEAPTWESVQKTVYVACKRAEWPSEDAGGRVTWILKGCPSIESLREAYGGTAKQLPGPVNAKATAGNALGGIPAGHSKIIVHSEPGGRKNRDARKRTPRLRNRKTQPVQQRLRYADFSQREKIRKDFIEICRHIVMDAAITHHRFLI